MISAFGVEHGYTEIEKAIKLESGEWVRMRSRTVLNRKGLPKRHHVRAMTAGKKPGQRQEVGEIEVNADPRRRGYRPGEVEWVGTKKKYRGQGIGGAMFRSAERSSPTGAYHSSNQTKAGKGYSVKTPNSPHAPAQPPKADRDRAIEFHHAVRGRLTRIRDRISQRRAS